MRCVLVRLTKEGLLFQGKTSEALLQHGAFTTRFVSLIEEFSHTNFFFTVRKYKNKHLDFRDNVNGVDVNTTGALNELKLAFNKEDIEIVKYICWLVSDRAAILVSICN